MDLRSFGSVCESVQKEQQESQNKYIESKNQAKLFALAKMVLQIKDQHKPSGKLVSCILRVDLTESEIRQALALQSIHVKSVTMPSDWCDILCCSPKSMYETYKIDWELDSILK